MEDTTLSQHQFDCHLKRTQCECSVSVPYLEGGGFVVRTSPCKYFQYIKLNIFQLYFKFRGFPPKNNEFRGTKNQRKSYKYVLIQVSLKSRVRYLPS